MNIYIIKHEYLSIMAEASTNTCMMAPAAWILWIIGNINIFQPCHYLELDGSWVSMQFTLGWYTPHLVS